MSDDLGVALYATKALANLDREAETYKFVDGVHLYHPQYRHQYVRILFSFSNVLFFSNENYLIESWLQGASGR